MSLHRRIDWNAARRDMRKDRSAAPNTGLLAAKAIEAARLERLAKEAGAVPFAVAGSYDRSAIMTAAIAHARLQRAKGNKAPWSQLVGQALRFTWSRAKQQRAFATH